MVVASLDSQKQPLQRWCRKRLKNIVLEDATPTTPFSSSLSTILVQQPNFASYNHSGSGCKAYLMGLQNNKKKTHNTFKAILGQATFNGNFIEEIKYI